jgi:hypothetical protein
MYAHTFSLVFFSYQLDSDDLQSGDGDTKSLLTVPTANFVVSQLRKMQSLLVNHNERIRSLEESVLSETEGERIESASMSDSAKKRKRIE